MTPKSRRRRITITLAALAIAVGAGTAFAALEGGAQITFELRIPDGDGGHFLGNDEQVEDSFNLAQCYCSAAEAGADLEHSFIMRLQMEPFVAQTDQTVEIWYGNGCDTTDPTTQQEQCTEGEAVGDVDTLSSPTDREIPIDELMFPGTASMGCEQAVGTESVYAMIDADGDDTYEDVFTYPVTFDSKRPPLPDEPIANPGEGAIQIEWDPPVASAEDVFMYQALCANATTGLPVFEEPTNEQEYNTGLTLCGEDDGLVVQAAGTTSAGPSLDAGPGPDASIADAGAGGDAGSDAGMGTPDAGAAVGLPAGLAELDPSFICGEAAGTETSLRISGLNNDSTYRVVLVPIDHSTNPNAVDLGVVTPKPVIDFWEDYQDQGGTAEGGFCLATSTFGGNHPFTTTLRDFRDDVLATTAAGRWITARYYDYIAPLGAVVEKSIVLRILAGLWLLPIVIGAAFWLYAGLFVQLLVFALIALLSTRTTPAPARRRSIAAAAAACALLFAPAASADEAVGGGVDRYDPYWDSFESPVEGSGPTPVKWLFGFQLGPYLPDIDADFSGEGPYERMFGNDKSLMFSMQLDRYFMWPAGQFGVTGSLGYMGNRAKAFATDRNDMGEVVILETPDGRVRSTESTNFRLIPTTIGAVSRFTDLDDRFGVPIIPYGKASLAYYIWWISAPDGVAEVPDDDCPDLTQDCDGNKARGASLGIQLTLGLSIRAERIDKQSARSMRSEMGIHHAGFYAEVQYGKVDGFGSDKKLAVGDFTWFGGINFEF
jgi:hypothetical protein